MCVCVIVCEADSGDDDNNLAIGTAEEEVPIDMDFSEYVDVEGRTSDYTSAANEADLLSDGLCTGDGPAVTTAVAKLVEYLCLCEF